MNPEDMYEYCGDTIEVKKFFDEEGNEYQFLREDGYPKDYGRIEKLKPKLKPIDWRELAVGVIIEKDEPYSTPFLSSGSFRSLGGYKISSVWQFWGPEHPGYNDGKCPLPEGVEYKIISRSGGEEVTDFPFWEHLDGRHDVIAFKAIGLADGYCYPGEEE